MTTIKMNDKFMIDAIQLKQLSNICNDLESKEMKDQMKEIIHMVLEQKMEGN